eukprot:472080_1
MQDRINITDATIDETPNTLIHNLFLPHKPIKPLIVATQLATENAKHNRTIWITGSSFFFKILSRTIIEYDINAAAAHIDTSNERVNLTPLIVDKHPQQLLFFFIDLNIIIDKFRGTFVDFIRWKV